jgi:hypothetical protein
LSVNLNCKNRRKKTAVGQALTAVFLWLPAAQSMLSLNPADQVSAPTAAAGIANDTSLCSQRSKNAFRLAWFATETQQFLPQARTVRTIVWCLS